MIPFHMLSVHFETLAHSFLHLAWIFRGVGWALRSAWEERNFTAAVSFLWQRKNIFKGGIPFNMQVVIPKMFQLLILFVTVSWNKTALLILACRLPPLKSSTFFLTLIMTELSLNTIKSKCSLAIHSKQLWGSSFSFRFLSQPAFIFTHQIIFSYVPSRRVITDFFSLFFNRISVSWQNWLCGMFCNGIKKSY